MAWDFPSPPTVMREVQYARRKRGRLGGWWKGLVTPLILVPCVWFGVRPEVAGTATAGPRLTLSANPCDTLQEVCSKNKDLRKELDKLPWPDLKCFSAKGRTYGLPLRAESRELSQRPATARLEYLAGFFDGDGCVSCMDMSGCRLKVSQSYDQAEVLMLFREAFGGSIGREQSGMGLRKPSLYWQLYGDSARRAARLLAPRSITKQRQLLIAAARWPKTNSRRKARKAELCALKNYDSAVAGPCGWSYFAGFFDAEGYIKQQRGGASLVLEIAQKHPQVLKCLRDFLSRSVGVDVSLRKKSGTNLHLLRIYGLSDCKQVLRHMLGVGLVCKAQQAEVALRLTKQNAGQVCARLTCLTGNQEFGRKLDAAGQERARKIACLRSQAARLKQRGRMTEAEAKRGEIALLKQEHEPLKARHENQQLLEYFGKLQSLHDNSWNGPLAQGM